MSDLQLGLLVIGAIVVVGVFAYNRRQEGAARRAAEGSFHSAHPDVLMEPRAERIEPVLAETHRVAARAAASSPAALPDPRIDYVMELSFSAPVAASALLEHWKSYEHRYAARAILACSEDGTAWHRLAPGGSSGASACRAGLQLVTRDGAVGEAELIEFRSAVETLAAATGAGVHAPEVKQAVDTARELDRFCADSDIQVVFHVTAPASDAFAGTKIRAVAEASGLVLEEDGRFALRNDADQVLFNLGARDGSRFAAATIKDAAPAGLSLSLDVPRVPDLGRSFQTMAGFARQLTTVLGGSLVDDNGNSLDDRAVAAISAQLDAVRGAFEARGIATGSAEALRLFS